MTNLSRIYHVSIYHVSIYHVFFSFLKIKFISPVSLSIRSNQLMHAWAEFDRCNLIISIFRSPEVLYDKRIKIIAIIKRRSSCVSSFFHLFAIHSSATLWSISQINMSRTYVSRAFYSFYDAFLLSSSYITRNSYRNFYPHFFVQRKMRKSRSSVENAYKVLRNFH